MVPNALFSSVRGLTSKPADCESTNRHAGPARNDVGSVFGSCGCTRCVSACLILVGLGRRESSRIAGLVPPSPDPYELIL